jgi:two-component system response regulator YesN
LRIVQVPLRWQRRRAARGPSAIGAKPGSTILLVDPDPGHAVSLLETVALVIARSSVAAALGALNQHQPHLIVLEYRLPDGSGLDVIAHARRKDARLPVVMATGAGSESVCAAAFRLGVADYLIKPIGPEQLLETVGRLLKAGPSRNGTVTVGDCDALTGGASGNVKAARVRRALRIIEAEYDEPISLAHLARAVGMGRFELSRQFSRLVGKSIRTYVGEYRIAKAKELLLTTERPMTEIAQLIGFGDLPRFDKVFGRLTGTTPSAYRKQSRN